ncbi:MAG: LytTR family DNA-binding domain-containing protein [Prevotellaceae bacterium]|jgi:DNA-binding LytR/AlgR family response regulator|nr:LytTR family DNA-binding domain-containing protein [Prevotellaceae bacterium]
MQVLIVEDETAASENLKAIIAEVAPEVELVCCTESVTQTIRWLATHPAPDLMFMDIHLSDGSAFNIFSAATVEAPIIFTTAYDEYAIDAFKVNSIDYLLKPISAGEVQRALEKFRRLSRHDVQRYLSQQPKLAAAGQYPEKILIAVNNKLIPACVGQVSYFYTTQGSTRVMLKDNSGYSYPRTLDSIYETLSPALFFRANKQFVVSKDSIRNITVCFDSRLLVALDTSVPEQVYVSKNKAALFKKWLTAS